MSGMKEAAPTGASEIPAGAANREAQGAALRPRPEVKAVAISDIGAAVAAGVSDFARAPIYGLFFGAFYAGAGWMLIGLVFVFDLVFLAYPLAAGFALIAPFVASGVYEVSRRLERGETLSWGAVLGAIRASSGRDLGWMAVVTLFMMVIWVEMATVIYLVFFGLTPLDWPQLVQAVTMTWNGFLFLALGNAAGAVIGLAVFSISAVSFPLLLDRDVDFVTAMIASVRAVFANPVPMLLWAACIAVSLGVCLLTLFAGLIVLLPVLGHASWHVYRRAIAIEGSEGEADPDGPLRGIPQAR